MEFVANPVRVKARQIDHLEKGGLGDCLACILTDGDRFIPDDGMLARYTPKPGDYVVEQEDGYIYLNPREVFERKYSPVGSRVSFAADREIDRFLRDAGERVLSRRENADMAVVIYGSYGGRFYVESTQSAVEAIGVMEVGKATMMAAVVQETFTPEQT